MVTFDLLFISVIVLLLVLIVLLIVCCILRCSRRRNLTELRVSNRQNTHVLTVKTEPDHAQQLLDQLLKRVFFQVELDTETLGEPEAEHKDEIELEHGSFSGSELEGSTPETSHHRKVISSPLDQTDDLTSQQSGVSQHPHQPEEQCDELQC